MKSNNKEIAILIPDGEIHVIMYVVNCFSLVKNVKVYVMSSKINSHMKYSRFIEKFIYYPETNHDEWIKQINYEVEKYGIDLVMPVYEKAINVLANNLSKLRYPDNLVNLSSAQDLYSAGNKGALYRHLKSHNIPCPNTLIIKPNNLTEIVNLNYPVVIKPVEGGGGGKGIKIATNKEEVLKYYTTYTFNCDSIIQEFINGYDLCCNVLCKDGDLIAYSIQKGTVFRDGILTPQIGFDFIENEALLQTTKKLMKSLNWSGVANIDWRFDEKENVFKVIEINTRFWLGTDAASIAGVNFPYLYCQSSLGQEIELKKTESISYLSLEGLARILKRNPLSVFKFKYIYNHSPIRFIIKDPFPILYKMLSILKLVGISLHLDYAIN